MTTKAGMTTKAVCSDRFEGDGRLGPEGDTRVRCWFCAHYTHHLETAIWKHDETGAYRPHWIKCRTCSKGLGHDPFILRRCEAFRPISPRLRIRLPDEAFQRGWKLDYGDDEHMQGRKNTI